MTPWTIAAVALLPPLGLMVAMSARGAMAGRLTAVQLAGSVSVVELVVMTFAFDQASSIDLALMLGFLSLPAILLFSLFLERWL